MAVLSSSDESIQSIQELAETVINCIRFSTQSLIRMYEKSNFFENEHAIVIHFGYSLSHGEYEFCACLTKVPHSFFENDEYSAVSQLSEFGRVFLGELTSISQSIVSGLFVKGDASVKVQILEECSCSEHPVSQAV